MHSFTIIKALAFTSIVNAVQFTNSQYNIKAGEPFSITWSGNTDPVTIFLKSGDSGNLQTVNTIVSGAMGQSFTWIPSASLTNQVYALEIIDDGHNNPNYSPQFTYSGGVAPLPTAPTTAMSTTAATMDSSSVTSPSSASSVTSAPMSTTTGTMPMSNSSATTHQTTSSVAGTSTAKASTTVTRSSTTTSRASATPSQSSTSDANSLANPMAFALLVGGTLAFFN